MVQKRVKVQSPSGEWVETDCTVIPPGEASDLSGSGPDFRGWDKHSTRRDQAEDSESDPPATVLTPAQLQQYDAGVDCYEFMTGEPE